ncbi:putative 1,3-beta-glucanosyltransferase [Saccharomycopsis crataegensis]|uniref:1,3-beta-glucanosyltransferase n=1 Tax=Saccharomycopsis crataegensis TaxID=43959 RepID=A0AAV5QKG9_9ASCO|nr:putative 1,3-beta-glucanosyltransferase [Saccharomycopsis crataegensis]
MLAKSLVSLATYLACANALIPLTIKGNRFIKPATKASDDGEVFFLKGVDYQPGGSSAYTGDDADGDVLSDANACYRDAYVLQQAGVNIIRTYTVNPDVDHDDCMSILNDAGIYVLLDVNSALDGQSLNRDSPSSSYNAEYLTRVFKVIEAFKGYPNLLGFFSGNEIINSESSAKLSPPYIRAVQRDMKQYIAAHANRTIPVGYSAADVSTLLKVSFNYLSCDNDDDSHADFFGLNSYEWCSGSTYSTSGYSTLNSTFSNASVPVFFSEYGCNTVTPRTFEEISEGIFGGLLNTFSGGLVYEYAEEANEYGLVVISDSNDTLSYKTDYDNFKSELGKVNSSLSIAESSVVNRSLASCSSSLIQSEDSSFNLTFTLPSQPSDITKLIKNGVSGASEGAIVNIDAKSSNYTILDSAGDEVDNAIVSFSGENEVNSQDGTTPSVASPSTSAVSSSSSTTKAASAANTSTSKGEAGVYNAGQIGPVAGLMALMVSALL